jgi:DNA invertase Pin-like site-specific DNA recombinase
MNVVIYARYSCSSQTEQSIEGQIAVCKKFAKQNNFTVIGEYIDRAFSATNDNRPQFLKMIKDSDRRTFNGVLVYKLDRFARNRNDSIIYKSKLKENNVTVISASEHIGKDASGIIMEAMLEAMAEYYSVELSEKVRRGMEINASKCLSNGGISPLGFTISSDKKYVINPETSPIVKKIFEMYANGNTMVEIVQYMNDRNYKTALGNAFSKNSIRGILCNKKYIGTYSYKGKEYPNSIPAIIDTETFDNVQIILSKNRRAPGHQKAKKEYLLTTKLFCGHCKEMMVGVSGTSKTKRIHYYYSCNNHRKKECNKANIKKEFIEDLVVQKARDFLTDSTINKLANTIVKRAKEENYNLDIECLEKALKNNKVQKNNLIDSLKFCQIDDVRKSICEELEKLEKEFTSIQNEVNSIKLQQVEITVPEIVFFLKNIRDGDVNDIYYKKHLINILINKIYLYDDYFIVIFNAKENTGEEKVPLIHRLESSFLDVSGTPTI